MKKTTNSSRKSQRSPQRIRIIGGQWKRSLLPVLDEEGLRPTTDRVRETLFNWLGQRLDGLHCVDLFAGAGALGFEAASRGAASVLMFDDNPRVVRQLRANAEKLNAQTVQIRHGDALQLAAALPDACADLVFVDPPFASILLPNALRQAARLMRDGGMVYVESAYELELERWSRELPGGRILVGFEVFRSGRAGQVSFQLLERRPLS